MDDKDKRRERAKRDVEQRREAEQRSESIEQKRQQARDLVPDPEDVNGPPSNTAVLLYLEELDERLKRIEDELRIE